MRFDLGFAHHWKRSTTHITVVSVHVLVSLYLSVHRWSATFLVCVTWDSAGSCDVALIRQYLPN